MKINHGSKLGRKNRDNVELFLLIYFLYNQFLIILYPCGYLATIMYFHGYLACIYNSPWLFNNNHVFQWYHVSTKKLCNKYHSSTAQIHQLPWEDLDWEFFRSFELHRHFLTCQTQLLGTEHNKASSQLDKGHAVSIPKINRNYMKLWSRHTVEHMDLYMIMAQSTYEWLFSSIILKEMVIYLKSLPENPTYRYVSITTL